MQTSMNAKKSGRGKELDLFEFLDFLMKRVLYIILAAVIGLSIAGVYVFMIAVPKYEATAQLYVVNSKDSVVNLSDLQIGSYLTSDYQYVFKTWEVNQMVIEKLNLPYTVSELRSMLTVVNPSNARVLFLTVKSVNAAEAARIANAYADVAMEYIPRTMQTEMPTLLSSALEPVKPVSPRKMLILAIAAFLSVFAALCILFYCYVRDDKVNTPSDITDVIGSAPLSVIPLMDSIQTAKSRR